MREGGGEGGGCVRARRRSYSASVCAEWGGWWWGVEWWCAATGIWVRPYDMMEILVKRRRMGKRRECLKVGVLARWKLG